MNFTASNVSVLWNNVTGNKVYFSEFTCNQLYHSILENQEVLRSCAESSAKFTPLTLTVIFVTGIIIGMLFYYLINKELEKVKQKNG